MVQIGPIGQLFIYWSAASLHFENKKKIIVLSNTGYKIIFRSAFFCIHIQTS